MELKGVERSGVDIDDARRPCCMGRGQLGAVEHIEWEQHSAAQADVKANPSLEEYITSYGAALRIGLDWGA